MLKSLLFILLLGLSAFAHALEFPLPPIGNDIIGYNFTIKTQQGDTIPKLARRYNMGVYELYEANRKLVQLHPLQVGTQLIIPMRIILPPGPREGIVVNTAEMRLYYFPKDSHTVHTYPIGIGRLGWNTPTGETTVVSKIKDPTWYVPETIRADAKTRGVDLPKTVAPGPANPLGKYALRLGLPGYLIHGTNAPRGVGTRTTSGCIRLYPEDIERIFPSIAKDMPVRIINMPYKVGWQGKTLFLEAHQPLQEDAELHQGFHSLTPMVKAIIAAEKNHRDPRINWRLAERVGELQQGLPVAIGGEGFLPQTL